MEALQVCSVDEWKRPTDDVSAAQMSRILEFLATDLRSVAAKKRQR